MKALLGKKVGMSQVYDDHGNVIPVTVVQVPENVVTAVFTLEKDNYIATQLACEDAVAKRLSQPVRKRFEKLNISPKKHMREIRNMSGYEVGKTVDLSIFTSGDFVDVTSISKGKGFAGAIKRHNFHRGPMTHGSHFHRSPGSLGAITQNRVFKGRKLPGHMGDERVTTKNLLVVAVDDHNNLLLLKGNVAGNRNVLLVVKQSVKKSVEPVVLSNIFEVDAKNKMLEEAKKYNLTLTTEMSLAQMSKLLDWPSQTKSWRWSQTKSWRWSQTKSWRWSQTKSWRSKR